MIQNSISPKVPLLWLIFSLALFLFSCRGNADVAEIISHESQLLAAFEYSGDWLDISSESSNARATYWKNDGTVVFVVGRGTDNVVAYRLEEPWQIQSGNLWMEMELEGSNQHGLYLRDDGMKMWVFDRTGIWTYLLEEPWNITTIGEGALTDFSDYIERGHDIDFTPDGRRLFVDDRNIGAVFQFDLASAWEVTTAEFNYKLDISDIQREVRGIEFIEEGGVMVLMDTRLRALLQFQLSEPWNISTANFAGSFDVSPQTSQGRGLSFSADERYFYVTCRDDSRIYQYQVSMED